MKFYLATDALDDVRWAAAQALIDGVVLPDAALRNATSPQSAQAWLTEFARDAGMPVFVALGATAENNTAEEAELLGRAADNVVVQIPFAEPDIAVLYQLAGTGVRVAATFVGSVAQALLAARTGVPYVFVDVDQLDAAGADGAGVIRDARQLFDAIGSQTDIVAVFPATSGSVIRCALAGADAAVVGTATLKLLLAYPFSHQSVPDGTHRPSQGERLRVSPD